MFISYIFQSESDKYIYLARISWLCIPIQTFDFSAILFWSCMTIGVSRRSGLISLLNSFLGSFRKLHGTLFHRITLNLNEKNAYVSLT